MLACQKSRFSLPADLHYLNCAYMAPLSKEVEAAGLVGLQRKRNPARITPEMYFTESDALRARFADLVQIPDPRTVAIVPSASYGIACVARNTSLHKNQNLVLLDEQFPSNVYSWVRLCRESGAELRRVSAPAGTSRRGEAWNESLLAAVDSGTALVAVPQIHWSDGTRFDLVALGRRAREVGAALVVDGTQSIGALPFDFAEVRPDALVCAGYKMLFGPYSLGLAYFGRRYEDGVPLEESWAPRQGSEDFARLVDYCDVYQPGAVRYDVGERSNFILVPMLAAGVAQVAGWGAKEIQAYCHQLTRGLLGELTDLGFAIGEEVWRAAHLFGVRPPAEVSVESLRAALEAEGVVVSVRGSALRISPHVYNDRHDIEALRRSLLACVSSPGRGRS